MKRRNNRSADASIAGIGSNLSEGNRGAPYKELEEQVSLQRDLILKHEERLAQLQLLLDEFKKKEQKYQHQISELRLRLQLARSELDRSKGQIELVKDLMLKQVRL